VIIDSQTLEAHLLSNPELQPVLMLGPAEMLGPGVLPVFAQAAPKGWVQRVTSLQDAMWRALAEGQSLEQRFEEARALFHEVGHFTEDNAVDPIVGQHGVVAEQIACLLDAAAKPRGVARDVNALFTAIRSISGVCMPEKRIWKGDDFAKFRMHPTQLILKQGWGALIAMAKADPTGFATLRENARIIGNALRTGLPSPPLRN
jgi:hypothetical protein